MADTKISDMTAASDLTGAVVPIVQGGVNKQAASTLFTSGGHVIEDEGTPLTQRTKLNFVGSGVAVTDDSGDDATVVTISSGGLTSDESDMLELAYLRSIYYLTNR